MKIHNKPQLEESIGFPLNIRKSIRPEPDSIQGPILALRPRERLSFVICSIEETRSGAAGALHYPGFRVFDGNQVIRLNQRLNRGAGMGILFFLLLAGTLYTPLSGLATLFLPAPLVLLFADGLDARAWMVLGIAFLALALGTGWVSVTMLLAAIGGFSLVLGRGVRAHRPKPAAVNAALVLVGFSFLSLLLLRLSGVNVLSTLFAQIKTALAQNPQLGRMAGLSPAALSQELQRSIQLYFPGFLVIVSILVTLVNLAVVRLAWRSRRSGDPVLSDIRFPPVVAGAFALAFVLRVLGVGAHSAAVWGIVSNAEVIGDFLLSIQALSLIWWRVRGRPFAALKMGGGFFLWAMPIVGQLFVLIGVLDVVFDFRKRRPKA